MKLENLLPVLDEYGKTELIDTETLTTLARYDGRDAIPENLNGRQIDYITAADNTIRVYVL